MSRWLCPNCKELHSTTGTPNEIEGYFLSGMVVETTRPDRDQSARDWVWEHGIPTNRCPSCGTIEVVEEEDD